MYENLAKRKIFVQKLILAHRVDSLKFPFHHPEPPTQDAEVHQHSKPHPERPIGE